MRRTPFILFFCFFLGSLILVSCSKDDSAEKETRRKKNASLTRTRFYKPEPVAQGYVGSESCRACHSEIMEEYASHPMSKSMSLTSSFPVEVYPTPNPVDGGKGATWSATKEGNKVAHVEKLQDSKGNPISEFEEVIEYTCGSGTRGCSYFVFEFGKLFQSPLTWYSQEKKWDLSPGFDKAHHPRMERTASDGCLACHAGRMNPMAKQRDTFDRQKPFHELSIGCERCHGPGKEHIEFHESTARDPGAVDPITNPEKLEPELREAVCYQCHLQGENRVVRYGRTEHDFRPGMHLADIWITFLKSGDTTGGKTEAVSQVEQMRQSQCFIQSKGTFGCISCHDPHRSPKEENRVEFFRSKCIACHQQGDQQEPTCNLPLAERKQKSEQDSCIQCHMPKLGAGDVAHTAQTDHRVHIPGDKYQYQLEEDDGFRIWTDKNVPKSALERAKTIVQAMPAFLRSDGVMADQAMAGLRFFHPPAKDDLALNESLAQLYAAKNQKDEANRIWSALLKIYPDDELLLTQFSLSLHESGDYQAAYPLYRKLFELNPRRPQVMMRYLDVCTKLNKFSEGLVVAKKIVELDPGARTAHQWLAQAYERSGDKERAKHHLELANRIRTE